VAIFNQKYFLLFLIYTALCCIYCGTLLVARFISCTNNLKQCTISGLQAVLCVLNFIEAIIFGLFCLIMLWDQLSAIFDNTPGIDALQQKKGESRGKYESLQEVFGERLNWRWWLPLDLPTRVEQEFELECDEMDDPAFAAEEREARHARQYEQQVLAAQRNGRGHAHAHEHEHGHRERGVESIADAHARSVGAPIVFPDAMRHGVHREDGINPLLASLQSPPHSPTLQGLQPRHANKVAMA
jgi:hypothetical protein